MGEHITFFRQILAHENVYERWKKFSFLFLSKQLFFFSDHTRNFFNQCSFSFLLFGCSFSIFNGLNASDNLEPILIDAVPEQLHKASEHLVSIGDQNLRDINEIHRNHFVYLELLPYLLFKVDHKV